MNITQSRQQVLRANAPTRGALQFWLRLFCALGACMALNACTPLQVAAANGIASFGHYSRQTDLAYGPLPANTLDLYLPAGGKHRPVVVFYFGGGWDSGDKASYKFVGAALADAGIIAVVPNYRLYPRAKFPAFMQDAAQAVVWARAHALDWGGDPERLYVVGHSAGAHIAVLLALDEQYLRQAGGSTRWLSGAVGLSGPYNFLPFTEHYLNDLFGPSANFPRTQPINYVRADAPPLLLMHGLRDQRVRPANTRSLAAAMQAVGGRVTTHYFEQAGHSDLIAAFSIAKHGRLPVLQDIREFMADINAARTDHLAERH
jgi:acetyl esterase/lipase